MRSEDLLVNLSPGELEIMEMLWGEGSVSLSQAHQAFLKRNRQIGYTTVQTRLNRLVEKGIICRSDEYPALYTAVLRREQISGRYFDLLESLCGGNIAPLMVHLSRKRQLTKDELAAMRSILEKQASVSKDEDESAASPS